ncbi:MAG: retroviral-like aspartic protease family protein [Candidatus Hodarchaeota archaeon]
MQTDIKQTKVMENDFYFGEARIPYIPVHINNSEKPYHFHLDIGAGTTTIFSDLAKELRIEQDENMTKTARSAAGELQIPLATLTSLSVGSEVISDLKVAVANMKCSDAGGALGSDVGGALGHDFLKNYVLHVNYPKRTLNFVKGNVKKIGSSVDLEYFNDLPIISIKTKINDKGPYWFILDTGASGNIMTTSLAEELGIATDKTVGQAMSPSGLTPVKFAQVNKFETKFKTIFNMSFCTMNLDHFNNLGPQKIGGILGYPFLKDFELIIDYPNKKLSLLETK